MRGRDEKFLQSLVGNHEGKRPLGRPRRRWNDNLEGVKEIGWKGVDWIHLAQGRGQWRAVVNIDNEPSDSIRGRKFFD
jgi:hypothetical protein